MCMWVRSTQILSGLVLLTMLSDLPAQTESAKERTLTEQLQQENADKLILDAQERGDIVRGAILFHQGNIACSKCHRPIEEKDRIGPNLSRLPEDVSPSSIVESILYPSKVIKKEYRSSVVVDTSGRVFTGVVATQDDDRIVLRDASDVARMITIPRANVEDIAQSDTSIMPARLADQLKSRQQFLDLLRYVLDLRERGPEAEMVVAKTQQRRELSSEIRGRVLLGQMNCTACHGDENGLAAANSLPKVAAPDLRWSARHLNPEYLADFIAAPHAIKPGTNMPHLLKSADAAVRKETASRIVDYLTSLDGNIYPEPDSESVDQSTVRRGHEVFHSVGCVACHAPRNMNAEEQPLAGSVPIGDLGRKHSLTSLTAFLEAPGKARPHGRMPDMRLTHREAVDVAAFLVQQASTSPGDNRALASAESIATGKTLFQSLQCGRCHRGIQEDLPTAAFADLAKLKTSEGCLAEIPHGKSPDWNLSALQREQLRAALKSPTGQLTSEQQIDVTLSHFNCLACHQRNELGGVTAARRTHFQTTNLNLGEQGRIPPTLTGVGAKLKQKWMRDVMVNGRSIRPYMKTRMPQFGEAQISRLMELFQSTDKLSATQFSKFDDQKAMRQRGMELAGNKGLNCVACHTYQFKISDTMPAVDLTEMAERLRKDWFHQYMLAPQTFSPNTVMPSFWPNGKAIRPDLAGTPKDQVEALWQYLLDGRQARAPRGVIREPLEIVVTDEARILRRSYPGMGKRGIGVGYPGGVNIAFDAEQMRLASIWNGRFVDPSGVWYGQGHGRVRALGPPTTFQPGPDLDDENSPWIVDDGRPPNHRFLGYTLDDGRRPAFRYLVGDATVEDYFREVNADSERPIRLQRRITISGNLKQRLRFRLLSGEQASIADGGRGAAGSGVNIRIVSGPAAKELRDGNTVDVFIPVAAGADTQTLILEYQRE